MAPLPQTLIDWLRVFGPGAVIASMTIGTGELIFSTRGGAIFGYRILPLFVIISLLKWGLMVTTARHFVLTGVHPYSRMQHFPGPKGWLPTIFMAVSLVTMPIWISFLCGTTGNLISHITSTVGMFHGGIDYVWGAVVMISILLISATSGYRTLERVQLVIVGIMIAIAFVTLILYKPNWLELLQGALIPQRLEYPDWIAKWRTMKEPPVEQGLRDIWEIARTSVWVETTRYVGVIGGGAVDYLAYTSFLREKRWGRTACGPLSESELQSIAADPEHPVRKWIRAPYLDCSISFLVLVAFSAVFVASGALVLGPEQQIPTESNMLDLQSRFVTEVHPWLGPLYYLGALLTLFGTAYGSFEITCAIVDEILRSFNPPFMNRNAKRVRRAVIAWAALLAMTILALLFFYQYGGSQARPKLLLKELLTPANLFAGVFACGIVCFTTIWMDQRFLPKTLRSPVGLRVLNGISGVVFLGLGIKGYLDRDNPWLAISSLFGLAMIGFAVSFALNKWSASANASPRVID